MQINRKIFFDEYRKRFGPLLQSQVDGLNLLLQFIEDDKHIQTRRQWIAYLLATVRHETGWPVEKMYTPVEEAGKGKGRVYGKMIDGKVYYGRGYVQLTWVDNYRKMSEITGVDLVKEPELALRPDISYQILSHGLRLGTFTGKKLGDYINDKVADYYNARRVVNALDKAALIAGYALQFDLILEKAIQSTDEKEADPLYHFQLAYGAREQLAEDMRPMWDYMKEVYCNGWDKAKDILNV